MSAHSPVILAPPVKAASTSVSSPWKALSPTPWVLECGARTSPLAR